MEVYGSQGGCSWFWKELHHVHDEHDKGGGGNGGCRVLQGDWREKRRIEHEELKREFERGIGIERAI